MEVLELQEGPERTYRFIAVSVCGLPMSAIASARLFAKVSGETATDGCYTKDTSRGDRWTAASEPDKY